ncbi:MAG: redoxin domain-containing protein [Chthoniobacterales bacterium]|nr:redoxin domain-containing protein [Chthoniobacterales bacterium]
MAPPANRKSLRWLFIAVAILFIVTVAFYFSKRPIATRTSPVAQDSVIAPSATATTPPTTPRKPQISADAERLLEQMRAACQGLKSAEFAGVVRSNVEAEGDQQSSETKFTSSFGEPKRFRHEAEDDLTLGSTGEKVFVFNKAANEYLMTDAPKGGGIEQLPAFIPELLQAQNPSLLFALLDDPGTALIGGFGKVDRAADADIGGTKYPVLVLTPDQPDGNITVIVDPVTHLLKQLRVDLKPALEQRGAKDVKVAETVIDYTTTRTDVALPAEHFAWTPPPNAQDVSGNLAAVQEHSETAMVGKPAPDFQLTTLDGKSVSLSELKGQVVVLDFWASWCPPCIESLPHLGKLYTEKRDQGVKVFAVNLGEDKAKVEAFLKAKGVDVPVLLDRTGEVAKKFNVTSIPQTVVIGKDGTVTKVLVGLADDGLQAIHNEVTKQREAN